MGHGHDEQGPARGLGSGHEGAGLERAEVANTLWAMATTGRVHREISDSLCRAAAAKMQDFNAQEVVDTLWAIDLANALGPWPQ